MLASSLLLLALPLSTLAASVSSPLSRGFTLSARQDVASACSTASDIATKCLANDPTAQKPETGKSPFLS